MRRAWVASLVVAAVLGGRALAEGGDDRTETIDLGDGGKDAGPTAVTPPVAPAAPPPEETVEARAWLRVGAWLGFDRVGQYDDKPDPFAVPHDRAVATGQIHMRLRYEKGKRYEIVASGLLTYNLFETDAKSIVPFTGFNGQHVATEFEPLLREAYVGFYWRLFDLRVGAQRIAWGRGDAFQPNDILNPRDLSDPILGETEVQRLPSFAVRADIDSGPASLEIVLQPFFRPSRYDVYGTNWAVIQDGAPAPYRGLMALQTSLVDPTLQGALQPLLGQSQLPKDDLSATQAGLRLRWSGKGYDGSYYFHYGYDATPRMVVDPQFAQALGMIDFSMASASSLDPVLQLIDMGVKPTDARYVRRVHQGADLETTHGSWVLRLDGAYDSEMVFVRRSDFQGVALPSIQLVAGAEYQTGQIGRTVLFEAMYHRLEGGAPRDGELLGTDQNSAALAMVWKWNFFDDQLAFELRALGGIGPTQYLLVPRMIWKVGNTQLHFGGIVMGGGDSSMAHYYRHNQGLFGYVKYAY